MQGSRFWSSAGPCLGTWSAVGMEEWWGQLLQRQRSRYSLGEAGRVWEKPWQHWEESLRWQRGECKVGECILEQCFSTVGVEGEKGLTLMVPVLLIMEGSRWWMDKRQWWSSVSLGVWACYPHLGKPLVGCMIWLCLTGSMTQAVLGIETSTGLSWISQLSDISLRNTKVFFTSGTVLQFPEPQSKAWGTWMLPRPGSHRLPLKDCFPRGSNDGPLSFWLQSIQQGCCYYIWVMLDAMVMGSNVSPVAFSQQAQRPEKGQLSAARSAVLPVQYMQAYPGTLTGGGIGPILLLGRGAESSSYSGLVPFSVLWYSLAETYLCHAQVEVRGAQQAGGRTVSLGIWSSTLSSFTTPQSSCLGNPAGSTMTGCRSEF